MQHFLRVLVHVALLTLLAVPVVATGAEDFAVVGVEPTLQYDDLFGSARDAAMAHAELSSSHGLGGIWSNPGADLRGDRDVDFSLSLSGDLPGVRLVEDLTHFAAGASFVRRSVRLSFALRDLSYTQRVRTALDPAAERTRIEVGRRDYAAGVAVDVTDALDHEGPVRWSAGAAWRTRKSDIGPNAETELRGSALDLGTTVAWWNPLSGLLRRVAAAAVFRNVFDGELDSNAEPGRDQPRTAHVGLSATAAHALRGIPVEGTLATASTHQLGNVDETGWHAGLELVVDELLAVRAGRHDVSYDTVISYGLGLRFDVDDRVLVHAEWTRQDIDTDLGKDAIDIWGLRAAFAF